MRFWHIPIHEHLLPHTKIAVTGPSIILALACTQTVLRYLTALLLQLKVDVQARGGKMNILITGAGLIGAHAARHAVDAGNKVVLYDLSPNRNYIHEIVGTDRADVVA